MESVFWALALVFLCLNLGFSHGFTEPLRMSVPLVHTGHLVKRNPQAQPGGASGSPPSEAPQQQNRPPSSGAQGSPNQEAAQPRSDTPTKSASSSSNNSKSSKPALTSKLRALQAHTRNSKIHKSSRPSKPDSDKASDKLTDESPQFRAQIPRRQPRPGPQGMQPERPQHSHSHSPSPQGAHSQGSYSHGPAYHGQQQQQQPASQFQPAPPAVNPQGIVEVEPGVDLTGGSTGTMDPNPVNWQEIREYLSKQVLKDLFKGFGRSLNVVKAVFRKIPVLLDKIQTE